MLRLVEKLSLFIRFHLAGRLVTQVLNNCRQPFSLFRYFTFHYDETFEDKVSFSF